MGTLPILAAPAVPLVKASHSFLGAAAPPIISAGALIGIFGTLNVIMLACTRLPFAMAVQGQLPVQLARVHRRFRTPHVSILVSAIAVLALALSGTFIYAVKVTVITRVIVYASTCLALPMLRRRSKLATSVRTVGETSRSFELPGGILISIVCVILCLWLLGSSRWGEGRAVGVGIVVRSAIFAATRFGGSRTNG